MSCSRCGQPRRTPPMPSTIHVPGAPRVTVPSSRPGSVPVSRPLPQNIIRESIVGLRYVPNR